MNFQGTHKARNLLTEWAVLFSPEVFQGFISLFSARQRFSDSIMSEKSFSVIVIAIVLDPKL
jgi:hypothetical protein